MSSKNYIFLFLVITTFFVGFIIGNLFNIPRIEIDKNINPLDALSIFVTLFIALLITVFFQTKKEINNTENGRRIQL